MIHKNITSYVVIMEKINDLYIEEYHEQKNNDDTKIILYYHGDTNNMKNNIMNYCNIFKNLFYDYNIAENNIQKNMLFKSLFFNNSKKKYSIEYNNNNIVIIHNDIIYHPNKTITSEKDINNISIFFDYKQQKNKKIDTLYDIMETDLYSYSKENKDCEEEYIKWIDKNNNEINFIFDNICIEFINKLNTVLTFTIHITPILEEYTFNIEPNTIQKGEIFNNYCVLFQNIIS